MICGKYFRQHYLNRYGKRFCESCRKSIPYQCLACGIPLGLRDRDESGLYVCQDCRENGVKEHGELETLYRKVLLVFLEMKYGVEKVWEAATGKS